MCICLLSSVFSNHTHYKVQASATSTHAVATMHTIFKLFMDALQTSIIDVKLNAKVVVRSARIVWCREYNSSTCFVLTYYTRHCWSGHYTILRNQYFSHLFTTHRHVLPTMNDAHSCLYSKTRSCQIILALLCTVVSVSTAFIQMTESNKKLHRW